MGSCDRAPSDLALLVFMPQAAFDDEHFVLDGRGVSVGDFAGPVIAKIAWTHIGRTRSGCPRDHDASKFSHLAEFGCGFDSRRIEFGGNGTVSRRRVARAIGQLTTKERLLHTKSASRVIGARLCQARLL